MLDQKQFVSAISQIAEEKGIPQERIIETIEMAIAAAYKRDYGQRGQMVRVELVDKDTGEMKFFQLKLVVDQSMLKEEKEEEDEEKQEDKEEKSISKPEEETEDKKIKFNFEKHIMLDEAKKLLKEGDVFLVGQVEDAEDTEDKIKMLKGVERKKGAEAVKKVKPQDYIEIPLKSHEAYGRIAAQTAKQVIMQRLKEAEREVIYDNFKSKEGEVVSGVVQRIERGSVFIDIGKTTGVMFYNEQIPSERYSVGQRIRVYITKVEYDPKGSLVMLSRACPNFVLKLFEFEVPEIESGSVEIKAIAREAGSRSKIAVTSSVEGVDPVGSCVGQKGTRVATIINELGGEKIDIIEWDKDEAKFISNALAPAKVFNVKIDKKKKEVRVEVDEDQLSLAIGKGGQNVRLAAKLTGWKIDIVVGGKKVKIEEEEEEKDEKDKNKKEKPAKSKKEDKEAKKEGKEEKESKKDVKENKEKKDEKEEKPTVDQPASPELKRGEPKAGKKETKKEDKK